MLEEIYNLLEKVTKGHVSYALNENVQMAINTKPFIIYQEMSNRPLTYADDRSLIREHLFQITLVTDNKDREQEKKLEDEFDTNNIDYSIASEFRNDDGSISVVYEVKMEEIKDE